jgi:hypothetical protein
MFSLGQTMGKPCHVKQSGVLNYSGTSYWQTGTQFVSTRQPNYTLWGYKKQHTTFFSV